MQPLISPINHESRHSLYHVEEDLRPTEQTPLLRGPRPEAIPLNRTRDHVATMVVTLLLILFISGVVIGIYLLIVQSNSENVLPPIDTPLQLVSESQWNSEAKRPMLPPAMFKAKVVIVVQTDTEPCQTVLRCTALLKDMQANMTEQQLPYNFLLSSNGQVYEALGWRQPSNMFPQFPHSLVLAFIGNFTDKPPTAAQLNEARNFFAESVSLRYLAPSYSIIGKGTKSLPKHLFTSISKFPHWNSEASDSY